MGQNSRISRQFRKNAKNNSGLSGNSGQLVVFLPLAANFGE
jgi:hypothetical protein